tara:strand:+ start:398 stop:928 length:531 start_codon:yes stop_codon:yes gene_type:complete
MLSLYNSLGLDGGSVSKGNKLLAIGNDVRGSFSQYSRTTFRSADTDPNEQGEQGDPRTDINQDGVVDAEDLTTFLGDFSDYNARSDFNEDGVVNASDLTILLGNWGNQFDVSGNEEGEEEEEEEEEENGENGGGGEPSDPPLVGVIETINGLVYPTSRVNVTNSPALPAWIKERNV